MERVLIRPARSDDVATIVDIHLRARRTYYEGVVADDVLADPGDAARRRSAFTTRVADPACTFLCAVHDERIAGFVLSGPCRRDSGPGPIELRQLHVDPECWGNGIGTALHDACLSSAREDGARVALLEVFDRNHRARTFYERRGWQLDGYRDTDPDAGLTHVGYRRTLT